MIEKNQQALLELLKASLFGAEPVFPEGVDWNAVLQEAKDQTVVALAAPAVPKEEADNWQIPTAQNKMRFFQLLDEQTKLGKLFQDAGIPMTIIKGFAAAMYYPVPMNRTMGDIDYVVLPERLDEARRLMEENGYAFSAKTDRHYDYAKNDIELEMHHHYSDPEWDFEALIAEGVADAAPCELYGKPFLILPTMINGLVLLDHVRRHIKKGLGLRQIIDWMMFVHAELNDDTAWKERFAPIAGKMGLETLAITLTKMCKTWLGLPDDITWCDSADDDTALQLLELVFYFGNFGRKDQDDRRFKEGIVVGIHNHGFFRHLQSTGKKNWKACQKYPFLRLFAWLYQLFRYLGKGIAAFSRGERFSRDVSAGKERAELYKDLGIER